MGVVGKIFDNTPSGKALTKRRDAALNKCADLGHDMQYLQRLVSKKENSIYWCCCNCGRDMVMDFLTGNEIGAALQHKCSNKSWL